MLNTIAVLRTGTGFLHLQDHLNPERARHLLFPLDAKVEFIAKVHNPIGLSGSWCRDEAEYYPWVKVLINGVEKTISTFYLTK